MHTISINRAPVLTLWAAVVDERPRFEHEEALAYGKAVTGLTAQAKGQRLGILTPSPAEVRRKRAEKTVAALEVILRVGLRVTGKVSGLSAR